MTTPAVYAAIAKVQGELAKIGISKDRKNASQGYSFRGIDDVYSALSPLLAAAGLCIIPRMLSRETAERATKSGGALYFVTVHAEFDFVAVADGSKHTASTFGEASDSGDKATNKAMSAAYKYAAFMAFAIPTDGDNDADAHTPEPQVRGWPDSVKAMVAGINAADDPLALRTWLKKHKPAIDALDTGAADHVATAYNARKAVLAETPTEHEQKEAA